MSNGLHVQRTRFADLALAAYLSPILEGRRVAVVGPTSGEVARRARALGAASVVCFGGTGEEIAVRALTPGAIAAFHGRLDVVLVPDAGAVPSLVAVLDEARRALGSEGVVVVASEPEDGPATLETGGRRSAGYHDLYELCSARFAAVRMLGRGPFLGYTVATLDEGSERVALDTRLIDGDPPRPEAFIAVASDTPQALDPLAVVQVPTDVLGALREAATQGLAEEIARRDQKLKEVEAASAERWVKIQRYEHGLKELEEESRKTRERAVRLSKELEDERKLRQRIELEAQMSRRVPELPKTPDLEPELRRTRDQVTVLERELVSARAAVTAAHARIHDLERELDETQGVEADLRGQLDEALERSEAPDRGPEADALAAERDRLRAEAEPLRAEIDAARRALEQERGASRGAREALFKAQETAKREAARQEREAREGQETAKREAARQEREAREGVGAAKREAEGVDADYARLETELRARASEVTQLRSDLAAREQAVRELAFTVEQMQKSGPAGDAAALRARLAEAASVYGALADKAEEIVHENALLRERLGQLEAEVLAHAGEAQQGRWRATELEAELARRQSAGGVEDTDAEDVSALRARHAELEGALGGLTTRALRNEKAMVDLEHAFADERAGREYERARGDEARNEVSRLYALNAGLDARATGLATELEGAHAGFRRRVVELEGEVERLVRALEVAGTQTASDADQRLAVLEREAALLRAEAQGMAFRLREAEAALSTRPVAPVAALPSAGGVSAAVSAALEDALDDDAAEARSSRFRLDQVLSDLSATAERLAQTEETLARTQEAYAEARRDMDAARSHGPASDEASLREGMDAARRELARQEDATRALMAQVDERDRRIDLVERRVAAEIAAMQQSLASEERANRSLRTSLEAVRAGLSSILIDGRGAVVAHDLVLLLRQIEASA